jgi:hypothetical protein
MGAGHSSIARNDFMLWFEDYDDSELPRVIAAVDGENLGTDEGAQSWKHRPSVLIAQIRLYFARIVGTWFI